MAQYCPLTQSLLALSLLSFLLSPLQSITSLVNSIFRSRNICIFFISFFFYAHTASVTVKTTKPEQLRHTHTYMQRGWGIYTHTHIQSNRKKVVSWPKTKRNVIKQRICQFAWTLWPTKDRHTHTHTQTQGGRVFWGRETMQIDGITSGKATAQHNKWIWIRQQGACLEGALSMYLSSCRAEKKSHVKIDMQIEREKKRERARDRVVNEIFCCCIDSCKLPHLVLSAILLNYKKAEKWENWKAAAEIAGKLFKTYFNGPQGRNPPSPKGLSTPKNTSS